MNLSSLNESLETKYGLNESEELLDEAGLFNRKVGKHEKSKSSDYVKKADDLEKKAQKLRAAYRFADAERAEAEANMYRNKAQAVNDSKVGGEPNLSNMTTRDYINKISDIFKNASPDKLKGTYEYYIWKTQQYYGLSEYGSNPVISQIQKVYKDIVSEKQAEQKSQQQTQKQPSRGLGDYNTDFPASNKQAEVKQQSNQKSEFNWDIQHDRLSDKVTDSFTQAIKNAVEEGILDIPLQQLNEVMPKLQQLFMHDLNAKLNNFRTQKSNNIVTSNNSKEQIEVSSAENKQKPTKQDTFKRYATFIDRANSPDSLAYYTQMILSKHLDKDVEDKLLDYSEQKLKSIQRK